MHTRQVFYHQYYLFSPRYKYVFMGQSHNWYILMWSLNSKKYVEELLQCWWEWKMVPALEKIFFSFIYEKLLKFSRYLKVHFYENIHKQEWFKAMKPLLLKIFYLAPPGPPNNQLNHTKLQIKPKMPLQIVKTIMKW